MTINLHTTPSEHDPLIQYVCQFIANHPLSPTDLNIDLNLSSATIQINYGTTSKTGLFIPKQNLAFQADGSAPDDYIANTYHSQTYTLYSVESEAKADTPFFSSGQFGFDIIEAIFFHISRFEEHHCPIEYKDEWDMMYETHHFLVKHNIHHIPVVDHLVFEFLISLGLSPRTRQTRFSLTHDVDVLRKFRNPNRILRSLVRSLLDNGLSGFAKTLQLIWRVLTKQDKDPYNSFEFLLVDSSTYHFEHFVLFIMNGGTSSHDNYYQINDNYLSSVIESARRMGYTIGLHSSYHTDQNGRQFEKEQSGLAKHLNHPIVYNRQHFLHFDFNKTANLIDDNDVKIDSTLGYQRLIGFRCGTGFPFHLFDFDSQKAFRFKELPMVVMDGGLLAEADQDIAAAQQLLSTFVKQNTQHTHITFNVHNTIFDPTKRDVEQMRKLYLQILGYG